MPGLSIHTKKRIEEPILSKFPNYKHRQFSTGEINISAIEYPKYSIKEIQNARFSFYIEGCTYGITDIETVLNTIAEDYFSHHKTEKLKSFIENTDGEYIILCKNNATEDFFVFNDYLGRLPLYYYTSKNEFIISREISTIVKTYQLQTEILSSVEFLLLGYPLGNKTLYQSCFRLDSASLLDYSVQKKLIKTVQLINLDFSESNTDIKDTTEASIFLKELFLKSVKARAQEQNNIVLSLSGGLDSRAILSAFQHLNIPHHLSTYTYGTSTDKDVEIAQQLANTYQNKLSLVALNASNDYSDTLFQMKQGLNYLGMSFILEFLEKLQGNYNYYWTGDGGDKLLPDIRPLRSIFSVKDLRNYILQTQQIYTPKTLSSIFPISEKDIYHQLYQHLDSYPEKNNADKYKRFLLKERASKWLFEGEDRNRYFMPSITPFYAVPFYRFAMSIPDKLKSDFKLFRNFLNLLDPQMAKINNANWGLSINQQKAISKLYRRQKIKSYLSTGINLYQVNTEEQEFHLDTLQMINSQTVKTN